MTLKLMKPLIVLFTMKELYWTPKYRQHLDRCPTLLQKPEKYA